MTRGVFPGETQRRGGNVCGRNSGEGTLEGQCDRNHTRACADIQDRHSGAAVASRIFENQLDELLGLGTGHESPAVADKQSPKKRGRTEQVLKGFPRSPIPNQFPKGTPLGVGKRAVEFEIKIQTFFAKDMGKQMLGVESRTFHPMLPKISGGGAQNLKDGHGMVELRVD